MRLNWLERVLVNSPFDTFLLRHFEARRLLAMGGQVRGELALEIGCGQGVGAAAITDIFGAARVHAFDIDPAMLRRARRRLRPRKDTVRLWRGDATAIPIPDNRYDAVFDFVVIHHIPDWQHALREIFRVLKPGGRLYAQEGLRRLVLNPVIRRLVVHPEDDPFDHAMFCSGLETAGFHIEDAWHFHEWFGFYIADKPGQGAAGEMRRNPG